MSQVKITVNNGITVTTIVHPIEFSRLFLNQNQKAGTITLEIKQKISKLSVYPAIRVQNDMRDNLFEMSDFGASGEGQKFTSNETRVDWLPVPVDTTEEVAKKVIDAANEKGACIYRILSSTPILTSDQRSALANRIGDFTLDKVANSQVVRYPEGTIDRNSGLDISGQIALDSESRVQYRKTFFSKTSKEDIDERGKVPEYRSKEIDLELMGATVVEEQII